MGLLRSLRKFASILLLGFCSFFILTIVSGQIEQHVFRRRAEQLLSEVQAIELRSTSWDEALRRSQHWGENRVIGKSCDSHECSFEITLKEFVWGYARQRNIFERLDDYLRWRLKLSYDTGPFVRTELWLLRQYMYAGGRPSCVVAQVGMRDGTVWQKGLTVTIDTPDPFNWFMKEPSGFVLIATVNGVPRMDYFSEPWISPQLGLHPNYEIGRPGGCEGCVAGWVKFTPYADPVDVRRLMGLNFSCLTRWHACVSQSDIMPSAWSQYLAEQSGWDSTLPCSATVVELLGRDSANAATAEVVRYREAPPDNLIATVRVIESLKGMRAWETGSTREVLLHRARYCAAESIQVGSKLIVYEGWRGPMEPKSDEKESWPVMPMTESNLTLFRSGVARDYSATDEIKARNPW